MINRVYMAGLQRGTTPPGQGDGEEAVAARLVESSGVVQKHLDELQALSTLDGASMTTIVLAHGAITHDLARQFVNTKPQSFVSKYLHFHCPHVPMYDQRAWVAFGRWVKENHPSFRVTKDFFPRTELRSSYYPTFAGRFLLLWEEAQRVRPRTSLKVIDHALWENWEVGKHPSASEQS